MATTTCVVHAAKYSKSEKLVEIQKSIHKRGRVPGLDVTTAKLQKVARLNKERCEELHKIEYPAPGSYDNVTEHEVDAVLQACRALSSELDSCSITKQMESMMQTYKAEMQTYKAEMQTEMNQMKQEIDKLKKANENREVRGWIDDARNMVAEDITGQKGAIWEDVETQLYEQTTCWDNVNSSAQKLFGIPVADWKLINDKVYKGLSNLVHQRMVPYDDAKAMVDVLPFNELWCTVISRHGTRRKQAFNFTDNETRRAKEALVKLIDKVGK